MKKVLLLFSLAVFVTGLGSAQTTVFQFTFENTEVVTVDNAVGTPTFSTFGVSGGSYFGGTVIGDCATTALLARSYSGWNTGDAYRFTVNTSNYTGLTFSFCARTSNVTIGNFICRVSPDGTTWTTIIPEFIPNTSFDSYSAGLPTNCENVSSVFIEIQKTDNAGLGSNNLRIDNATLDAAVVLPVELYAFTARKENETTAITFSTASERDNDYFAIERGDYITRFEEIGQVKGAGDSNEPQHYSFTDKTPLPGKNYYRLRQVDFDGKITYSNVISVRFDESGSLVLYPVPAFDQLKVTLEKASLEDGNWQILDQNSRVVGSGVLPAETSNIDINTSSLPEGFYIFRLSLGYNVLTRKFQKRQ